jgi:hypothetical protein
MPEDPTLQPEPAKLVLVTRDENPFKGLLRSRKFWIAVLALGNTIVSTYFQVPQNVTISVNAVLLVVIGSIAYEDAAAA